MTGRHGVSWIRRVTTATAASAAAAPTIPALTTQPTYTPAAHVVAVSTAWHKLTGRPAPMWWTDS
jgi:hypothetical protein